VDAWILRFLSVVRTSVPHLVLDPSGKVGHGWLDPHLVMADVLRIQEHLTRLNPAGAAYYEKNVQAYEEQLKILDGHVTRKLHSIPPSHRILTTAHGAFESFAARYGLKTLSLHGNSTDEEPSPKRLSDLIRFIRAHKVPAIFLEDGANSRLMIQLAQEAHVPIGGTLYGETLSPPGGVADTYLKMIDYNATVLAHALGVRKN
jgi:ABC-type Zn uptake system ZnuABC Zn-binding protein ZnuA